MVGCDELALELDEQDGTEEDMKTTETQAMKASLEEAKPPPQEQKEPAEQVEETPKIPVQLSMKECQQMHDNIQSCTP